MDDGVDVDLVSSALADAQEMSRGLPSWRRRGPQGRSRARGRTARHDDDQGARRGGYSAAGPDPVRDPARLGAVLADHVADQGWQQPLAEGRVFAEWSTLVGADVAAHCHPETLRDGELRISAQSTAWATQLRLLSSTLLARLVAELGPHVVTKLHVAGPTGPSWKHGGRSVRGARGPRDTYG